MCGFVGYVDWQPFDHATRFGRLIEATRLLAHRGPDDEAFYESPKCSLGFRRLKIIDLSDDARQPMVSHDRRYWIVFNGEIYNYRELRDRLTGIGHEFRTRSDTEVLLAAFQQWGPACLEHLNGMFAFAIWDERSRRLFMARDRFGEKPLYYMPLDTGLLFASEIKAVISLVRSTPSWHPEAVRNYLQDGFSDVAPITFYQSIYSLRPAHWLSFRNGVLEEHRYWNLSASTETPDAPVRQLRDSFLEAVALRTRSDVPLGTCLSGGLDSGAIACALSHLSDENAQITRKTFTAAYPDYDETTQVDAVNRQSDSRGFSIVPQPAEITDIEKLLWYHDEPFHSMAVFASFEVMRLARAHGVTVLLNGQGADELLAGYAKFLKPYLAQMVFALSPVHALHAMTRGRAISGNRIRDIVRGAIRVTAREWVALSSTLKSRSMARRNINGSKQCFMRREFVERTSRAPEPPSPPPGTHLLKRCLYKSLFGNRLPLYLRVEDRNSMAHSLESRLPFLDHRFAELVFSIPDYWFMRNGSNKFLLREAMKGIVPEVVRTRRDKFGFPIPSARWLHGPLRQEARDALASTLLRDTGIFDIDRMLAGFDSLRPEDQQGTAFYWRVVLLSLWLQKQQKHPENAQSPGNDDAMCVVNTK